MGTSAARADAENLGSWRFTLPGFKKKLAKQPDDVRPVHPRAPLIPFHVVHACDPIQPPHGFLMKGRLSVAPKRHSEVF